MKRKIRLGESCVATLQLATATLPPRYRTPIAQNPFASFQHLSDLTLRHLCLCSLSDGDG
jgi:hypothetical protein